MCVPACTQKTPSVRCRFHQRRLTNTPRRHRLGDGQLSSLYPHQVSARLAPPLVMLCCSAPPACSRTPLRPSVHYPSISLVVKMMFIQIFRDHLNALYIFQGCPRHKIPIRYIMAQLLAITAFARHDSAATQNHGSLYTVIKSHGIARHASAVGENHGSRGTVIINHGICTARFRGRR